jgi:serine/threonine protein kinase
MVKVKDFLGPYRLARLIRLGSTCQVWEAIRDQDGQRVALKVLRPEQRGNKEEIAFLKHEYEVAKALSHRNIIKLIDYVTEAETPFIVLELFSELNLKMALRRGPEPIAYQLPNIVVQACEGLYYLHSKGYVHCDIKSDIYSMGCMLYELIVGRAPFTGNTPNELLSKHLSAPIPSALVNNDNVSPEFNNIIKKMLAKKLEDRPENMWDVLKMIRSTPIFKKPPRIPESSVFDDFQGGGRIEAPT